MPNHALQAAALALLLAAAPNAGAAQSGLSQPVQLGAATFRWLGIPFYNAVLFTEGAAGFSWQQPLALRLDYLRSISRTQLANATRDEIARLEGNSADQKALAAKLADCFRDVGKGDSFLAIGRAADQVELQLNGRRTCTVQHPGARQRFLSIWLSPQSRSSTLSRQLRGG